LKSLSKGEDVYNGIHISRKIQQLHSRKHVMKMVDHWKSSFHIAEFGEILSQSKDDDFVEIVVIVTHDIFFILTYKSVVKISFQGAPL